jgi:hyperosmotically inducible protein
MRQETPSRRKSFSNVLLIAAGALASGSGLMGCQRPDTQQQADIPAAPAMAREAQPAPRVAASLPPTQLPSAEALTDTVITGRIKTAILADPGMAGSDVSVNTDRGVVLLAGVVKTPEQTAIASAHAQRQDGVMRVDNHLAVPPT